MWANPALKPVRYGVPELYVMQQNAASVASYESTSVRGAMRTEFQAFSEPSEWTEQ
jgi:hypothetical protein